MKTILLCLSLFLLGDLAVSDMPEESVGSEVQRVYFVRSSASEPGGTDFVGALFRESDGRLSVVIYATDGRGRNFSNSESVYTVEDFQAFRVGRSINFLSLGDVVVIAEGTIVSEYVEREGLFGVRFDELVSEVRNTTPNLDVSEIREMGYAVPSANFESEWCFETE